MEFQSQDKKSELSLNVARHSQMKAARPALAQSVAEVLERLDAQDVQLVGAPATAQGFVVRVVLCIHVRNWCCTVKSCSWPRRTRALSKSAALRRCAPTAAKKAQTDCMTFAHFAKLDAERFELRHRVNDPLRGDDEDEVTHEEGGRRGRRHGDGQRLDVNVALDSQQLYASQRVLSRSAGSPSSEDVLGLLADSALERFYTFADWIAESLKRCHPIKTV